MDSRMRELNAALGHKDRATSPVKSKAQRQHERRLRYLVETGRMDEAQKEKAKS
jgi:hypothetical protein